MINNSSSTESFTDDLFEYGNDIQIFYSLYKTLTLEDLAKVDAKHIVIGLARVIDKVLKVEKRV